jgi:polyhydroxybutyrate depolymerase
MRLVILLVVVSIALCCCSKDDGEATPVVKVYDTTGFFTHDGETRTYRVHLPTSYYDTDNKLPLVLGLHGGGGSGEQFETQTELSSKSDAAGFIIVYPDGLTNPNATRVRTWNAGKCCGANASTLNTDDVGFISKLIDKITTDYRVDSKKIYATGHSNGAMMCYRLANELSTKLAAIAPNAGNFQMKSAYAPTRNVPVIHINSKLDMNVKYAGGMTEGPGGQYNPPVDSCLNVIAGLAGCAVSKGVVKSETLYTEYAWSDCTPGTFEVLLYLTEDGGHAWPGGNKGSAFADDPSQAFVNNDIIWDFFQKYSLP